MRELFRSPLLLELFYASLVDTHERDMKDLGRALGVYWDPMTVHMYAGSLNKGRKGKERSSVQKDPFWFPLSLILAHSDFVKEWAKSIPLPGDSGVPPLVALGDYKPEGDEQIISLSDKTKNQFFEVLSRAGVYGGFIKPRADSSDETAQFDSSKDSDASDAKAEREREAEPITPVSKDKFKRTMRTILPGWSDAPVFIGSDGKPKKEGDEG